MNRTQKILGSSLISLLFITITLFSMCGVHMQRIASEDDLVFQTEQQNSFAEEFTYFDDSVTDSDSSPDSESEIAAALEDVGTMPVAPETDSAFVEPSIAEVTLLRLRSLVSNEFSGTHSLPKAQTSAQGRLLASSDRLFDPSRQGAFANANSADNALVSLATSLEMREVLRRERMQAAANAPKPQAPAAVAPAKTTAPVATLRYPAPAKKSTVTTKAARRGKKSARKSPRPAAFTKLYADAMHDFHNKRYDRAVAKFRRLLVRADGGDLLDNCQYWIGEAYFAMGEYYQAIAEFEKVLAYSHSNKLATAQLMVGRALLQVGRAGEAKSEFTAALALTRNPALKRKARHYLRKLQNV